MTTGKSGVQVVAAAMPHEVLADYEGMVREAGFEPGAVLPSTLAALAGLGEGEHPTLVVNAGREGCLLYTSCPSCRPCRASEFASRSRPSCSG